MMIGSDRKTHSTQRERVQFICDICGDGLSSNAKLSYHIQAKHSDTDNKEKEEPSAVSSTSTSKASSSSTYNSSITNGVAGKKTTQITAKNVKTPSPLPRAAASVPLASRPRVIARIVRKSAAASASSSPQSSAPSLASPTSMNMSMTCSAAVEATSTMEQAEVHDGAHACADDTKIKREDASNDFHYVEAGTPNSLRRSTRLILICSQGCGAIFHSHPDLARHELVHTSAAVATTARQRSVSSVSSSDIKNVLATATGMGPYPCGSCGQMFKRRGNLLRHTNLQICNPSASSSRSIIKVEEDETSCNTSRVEEVSCAAAPQPIELTSGGFFTAPTSTSGVADKDSITHVQQVVSQVPQVSAEGPLSLSLFGDNDCSAAAADAHTNGNANYDGICHTFESMLPCLEALPSGMAMVTSPLVGGGGVAPHTLTEDWPLLDDPLSFDIYTLDPTLFQY